jgi:hypothetical protein
MIFRRGVREYDAANRAVAAGYEGDLPSAIGAKHLIGCAGKNIRTCQAKRRKKRIR